jgi:hypothetical protein
VSRHVAATFNDLFVGPAAGACSVDFSDALRDGLSIVVEETADGAGVTALAVPAMICFPSIIKPAAMRAAIPRTDRNVFVIAPPKATCLSWHSPDESGSLQSEIVWFEPPSDEAYLLGLIGARL